MTFRHDANACLCALAVSLSGCSGGDNAASERVASPPSALAALLDEADRAMAAGQTADARGVIDEAVDLAPDDPAVWVAMARLRLRAGENVTALKAADRALELGPDHPPALLLRALMVRDAHGHPAAVPWFRAALTADPFYVDAWAEYAATLGDGGEAGAMLEAVRRLAEIAPDDARVPYLQAVLAARGGKYPLARSLLSRSGLAERGVPAALQLDAIINLAEGNADSATAILERLCARQPANARLRELLAKALFDAGRVDELVGRFGLDAKRLEASPYLVMLVARAQEQRGDRASASPLLDRATRGASKGPVVLAPREGLPTPTTTIRAAGFAHNWAKASAEAKTLSARFPASADVAALAGDAALGAGNPQRALSAYGIALQVKRPWPLTRKVALAYTKAGEIAASDALLARHAAGEHNNASALISLAERLSQSGDWERAASLLDHAIAMGAGHDPVLLGLRFRAAQAKEQEGEARRFAALLAEIRPSPIVQR